MGNKIKLLKEGTKFAGKATDTFFYWLGRGFETGNQWLDMAKESTRHGIASKRQDTVEVEETFDPKSEFLDSLKSWIDKPENQGKSILDYQAEDPDGLFAKLKGESHD